MQVTFPHFRTRFLVLLSFCIATTFSYAQMGVAKTRIEEVGQIKEKPLLVVLEDETDPYYEAHFNENFRKAVEMVWTFSPSVKFMSHEAYLQMREKKDETIDYAVLGYYNNEVMGDAPGHSFAICLLDKKVSAHFVKMYKSGETWSSGDLVLGLTLLQKDLDNAIKLDPKVSKEQLRNAFTTLPVESVKNKILLIDLNSISDDLKENIGTLYEYNYKIVTKREIDSAIVNRDPNVICFIKVINAPRPAMKIVQGDIVDGSREASGMLKRTPDKKVESSLKDIVVHTIYDPEKESILFFSSIGFKDTKIDVKVLKKIKKALLYFQTHTVYGLFLWQCIG